MKSYNYLIYQLLVFISALGLSGCSMIDNPNYSNLKSKVQKVDISNINLKDKGNGKFNFKHSQLIQYDIEGHHSTILSNYSDGLLTYKELKNSIDFSIKQKVSFFSKYVKLNYSTDFCNNIVDNSVNINVLNEDNSIDYLLTQKVNNNKKIKKQIKYMGQTKGNAILCKKWTVGEIKDDTNSFKSFLSTDIGDENLKFNIVKFPLQYEGIVKYKHKKYYLFTVSNGKINIVDKDSNDKAGFLSINLNTLINIDTNIVERLTSTVKGSVFIKNYNVNLSIDNKYNLDSIKTIN